MVEVAANPVSRYGLVNWHSGFGSTSKSPRKIVPKGRPLEVLQFAENRRSNLICGAVPEGVVLKYVPCQWLTRLSSSSGAVNFSIVVTQKQCRLRLHLTKRFTSCVESRA